MGENGLHKNLLTETENGFGELVGRSEPMKALYQLLATVGPSTASVLIVGESGTGKELVARTLHALSDRRQNQFVALNCAAVPETLIESELFGHERGAFTGADRQKPGCFELANGGTLFLDELTSMQVASQVKLLRVLEERSFRRLRGTHEIEVDVRVVAAMNEDPETAVAKERLRPDLLFRLNVFTLRLPPLRERIDDVALLATQFLRQLAAANGKSLTGLDPEALAALSAYRWPGNVRELRNAIERAVILEGRSTLSIDSLPPAVSRREPETSAALGVSGAKGEPIAAVGMTVDQVMRRLILRTLAATEFNRTKAAALLGVSSKTIYNKLKQWNVELPFSDSAQAVEEAVVGSTTRGFPLPG
jgi:DNA-binding NtrC family response regulator